MPAADSNRYPCDRRSKFSWLFTEYRLLPGERAAGGPTAKPYYACPEGKNRGSGAKIFLRQPIDFRFSVPFLPGHKKGRFCPETALIICRMSGFFYKLAANSLASLMARLASSSPANSAPPTRCRPKVLLSSAFRVSCSSLTDTWPAQITMLSTSRTRWLLSSPLVMVMCRPCSSILSYDTPPICSTPFIFITARCTQPVVLFRPLPSDDALRCIIMTLRGDASTSGFIKPPRVELVISTPHSFIQASRFSVVDSPSWVRYSLISKPIPPAPITATVLPSCSSLSSTS